ncbi:hypothetical protein Rhopal_006460-T1 [Rhodotorula paludigena]|uniref:Uncharacterized protein n=1 Tax=Rhodotorula paludigena TaxID=86838 RepID=A0AAV5GV74_9BASI|nr:hypothetical protein Rhopal_006460-T1 [Rhodotorula paludigena]
MAAYAKLAPDDQAELGALATPPPLTRPAVLWRLARSQAGWILACLLLVHAVSPLDPHRPPFELTRERTQLVNRPRRLRECFDPYSSPGYIYRPTNLSMRHFAYHPAASLDDLTSYTAINDSLDPPDDALLLTAPAYGDMLNQRDKPSELDWARDKSIWFIGDSHDRMNLEVFCRQHEEGGAVLDVPHWHVKANCRFPDLNLTFASFFHYGLSPESESSPPDAWNIPALPTSRENENPGPYSVERKVWDVWRPAVSEVGHPSVIVLNSFFWDLRYFAIHAQHHDHSEYRQRWERALTYSELAWHRARVRVFVESVREAFPGVPVMFRLGQAHQTNRNEGNVAVYQLNQSLRAVLARLDVPIFEWADLLSGESQYGDDQHLKPGAPARLFADMSMWYLWRAVVAGWDTCLDWPAVPKA